MTEFIVTYMVKVSAKGKKDLERKAEQIGETLSKTLRKSVLPHGYVEITKKDTVKQSTLDIGGKNK